jgi:diadenosine tetraphosphate (Ap4A) HIT family hydrolase
VNQEFSAIECPFCFAIKSGVTPRFKQLLPKYPTTDILFQNKSFFLVPDDSPLVPNHLLLIFKGHFLSCASISAKDYPNLLALKEKASKFLSWANPKALIIFFEHGAGKIKNNKVRCGACLGIDHAHMHIVPILSKSKINPFQYLTMKIQKTLKVSSLTISLNELLKYKLKPYLYLENNDKINLFFPTKEDVYFIPSQFMRRLIGLYLRLPDNDWDLRHLHREHRDLERKRVYETIKKFRDYETKIGKI